MRTSYPKQRKDNARSPDVQGRNEGKRNLDEFFLKTVACVGNAETTTGGRLQIMPNPWEAFMR